MAYTRNFGFRSFENIVRSGRFRTPTSGAVTIGQPVVLDPANAGRVKAATASFVPDGSCGVAVYEFIQAPGQDPNLLGAGDLSTIPVGAYAQIVHGMGVKIWLRDTGPKTLYDGRVQAAYTPFGTGIVLATLAIGSFLTPDGSGKWIAGTAANGWLTVESVNPTAKLVEARFKF